MSVKINSLELENVKRIRAVQLEPKKEGLTVIGGRNNQGKTSVLDAIAWALGGDRMRPEAPNRDGAATSAHLKVVLDNGIIVERKGKRGALTVTDPKGMKGGQQLLNEFLSQLALDLPRFLNGSDKDKATALLQTLGIDEQLAQVDAEIKGAYSEREMAGREARSKEAHAKELPRWDDAPEAAVDVAALAAKQREMAEKNAENQRMRDAAETAKKIALAAQERVHELTAELKKAEKKELDSYKEYTEAVKRAENLVDEPIADITRQIQEAETVNAKVRDNEAAASADMEAESARREYQKLNQKVEGLRQQRLALLDGAPMPLEGLSVDEDAQLLYNGHLWSDMSSSEQLRVATAIVRASKPECGFVLVDKLEQFDTDTLAEFGAWAESEGLQVIGTRVSSGDECTVIIEDGRVLGAEGGDAE